MRKLAMFLLFVFVSALSSDGLTAPGGGHNNFFFEDNETYIEVNKKPDEKRAFNLYEGATWTYAIRIPELAGYYFDRRSMVPPLKEAALYDYHSKVWKFTPEKEGVHILKLKASKDFSHKSGNGLPANAIIMEMSIEKDELKAFKPGQKIYWIYLEDKEFFFEVITTSTTNNKNILNFDKSITWKTLFFNADIGISSADDTGTYYNEATSAIETETNDEIIYDGTVECFGELCHYFIRYFFVDNRIYSEERFMSPQKGLVLLRQFSPDGLLLVSITLTGFEKPK